MNNYLNVLKRFADFNGRSSRQEYWFFVLINILISICLIAIDDATGLFNQEAGVGLLSGIYSLAIVIPSLSVTVRRLHDTDRSGWWILISLIPIVGGIVLLIFMIQDSTPGANEYGPNTKV